MHEENLLRKRRNKGRNYGLFKIKMSKLIVLQSSKGYLKKGYQEIGLSGSACLPPVCLPTGRPDGSQGSQVTQDTRRFMGKTICDHLRLICENLRSRYFFRCLW
jgi:hypothetical protein